MSAGMILYLQASSGVVPEGLSPPPLSGGPAAQRHLEGNPTQPRPISAGESRRPRGLRTLDLTQVRAQ